MTKPKKNAVEEVTEFAEKVSEEINEPSNSEPEKPSRRQ